MSFANLRVRMSSPPIHLLDVSMPKLVKLSHLSFRNPVPEITHNIAGIHWDDVGECARDRVAMKWPNIVVSLFVTLHAKGLWAMSFQIRVPPQIAQNRFANGSRLGLEDRGEEIISQST